MARKLLTELVIGLVILGVMLAALFVAVRGGYVSGVTIDGLHAEFDAGWWSVNAWVASTNDFYPGYRGLPLPPHFLGLSAGAVRETADAVALGSPHVYVAVPLWFIAMILLLPPLLMVRRRMAARTRRLAEMAGICPSCGRDLRGYTAGERCPKCGKVIDVSPPGDPVVSH